MAHTPGPWPKDYVQAAVRHIARNCDFIESEQHPEFGWDRYNGDADLISEAPELLRHAEAVLATLGPVAAEDNYYLAEAVYHLKRSVAEARGEAEGRDAK